MGSRPFKRGDWVAVERGGEVYYFTTVRSVSLTGIVRLTDAIATFTADGKERNPAFSFFGAMTMRHMTPVERRKQERDDLRESIATKIHRLPLSKLRAIAAIIKGDK